MKKPRSVHAAENFGRTRLSKSFFMRDFLHSEIANIYGIVNLPDDPELAIAAGRRLCEELLEPIQDSFGRISIRSAYRSIAVNDFGNRHGYNCASTQSNFARHIWDRRDPSGMGAMACIVVPWLADKADREAAWQGLAWWIHDQLPYSRIQFFPKLLALNIGWHEKPRREIYSFVRPRGCLTKPGFANHNGDHSIYYRDFPPLRRSSVMLEEVSTACPGLVYP